MSRVDSRVDDVAAAFVETLGPMTTMKLQKLVYYAQAWYAAAELGVLFGDEVEAWSNGPVVHRLYSQHRNAFIVSSWPGGSAASLGPDARRIVADVAARYGEFSGDELSAMTHIETPWQQARAGLQEGAWSRRPIPLATMASYYRGQVLSPAEAVRHARANAALEGHTVSAKDAEVLLRIADGTVDADQAVAAYVASHTRAASPTWVG